MTAPTTATRSTWTIDQAHTTVDFEIRHLMISKVRGRFTGVEGAVQLDEENLADSSVEVRIDAASIDTGEKDRDAHLRSPDFFDVERFPALSFRSRSVEPAGDGGFRVLGDLTIRDTTREVILNVEDAGRASDPWGNERAVFRAQTKIDRRDFGLTWNAALESGGVLVGHDVAIVLEVQTVRMSD